MRNYRLVVVAIWFAAALAREQSPIENASGDLPRRPPSQSRCMRSSPMRSDRLRRELTQCEMHWNFIIGLAYFAASDARTAITNWISIALRDGSCNESSCDVGD